MVPGLAVGRLAVGRLARLPAVAGLLAVAGVRLRSGCVGIVRVTGVSGSAHRRARFVSADQKVGAPLDLNQALLTGCSSSAMMATEMASPTRELVLKSLIMLNT